MTPDDIDRLGIVDALDALPGPQAFSPEGYRRLSSLAAELRGLRRRTGQSLPELVHDVERTLGLDVEVAARRGPSGRVNLDRFLDVAAEFEAIGESPMLSAFLSYLDAAETAERGLAPGEVEVAGDRVQVLTVHGSKGLEWDAVFVAGLVDKVFPAGGDKHKAWLGDPGELPYPLRGDATSLPALDLTTAADHDAAHAAVGRFVVEAADAARLEERRLAYVAVTRARSMLSCSGYRWDSAVRPRGVSPFLDEVREACADGAGTVAVWVDDPGETNPLAAADQSVPWPLDPLGERRSVIEAGAALVRTAMAGEVDVDAQIAAKEWGDEVDRLLAERERYTRDRPVEVVLPERLSVSQLVLLREDPQALARALRRPIPRSPEPRARRGTAFHAWLESRWGAPRLLDVDELPGSSDDGHAPDQEIAELQQAFLASPWAHRAPVEVEAPFELLVAGVLLRGRVDAVFETADGGIEVVDWKTGRPPRDSADESAKTVQLAAYRLAFAQLRGLPLDRVGAAFHYVRDDVTLRPADLLDEDQLSALVASVPLAEAETR
jgi:DNA helicase-2/ATP-dependent DNA helicase PcrA